MNESQNQEPVAWINWCAATGKRSVSFECESELASEPLYAGITQNTQYHYSKFHSWFDSELHRQKYTKDHPAYLAAQEAWNAANDAAQHRINRLNAEIEAWKVRFKIAEDALAKLNGPEQKPVQQQEPVVWMYVNKSTHETKFQKHMRDFVDHSLWSEVPLYGEPLANHELQCVCGAVWLGDEMVHLPNKHQPASKPLTDEEIESINVKFAGSRDLARLFARAIEAAHGIKENT